MNDQLTTAIGDLQDRHLVCRDLGHRWVLRAHHSRLVETLADRHVPAVERVVRCANCHTRRTEQFRRSDGVLLRRVYAYPDGYRFPAGVAGRGSLPKSHFRREWIERTAP